MQYLVEPMHAFGALGSVIIFEHGIAPFGFDSSEPLLALDAVVPHLKYLCAQIRTSCFAIIDNLLCLFSECSEPHGSMRVP